MEVLYIHDHQEEVANTTLVINSNRVQLDKVLNKYEV